MCPVIERGTLLHRTYWTYRDMVPIITYHGVGPEGPPLFTSSDTLEKHLQQMRAAGYHTATVSSLVRWIKREGELPAKRIVLTFDDGYLSVYTEALPQLSRYGFIGTVFLVTDFIGRDNQWSGQSSSIPALPLMSWDQIAKLGEAGWEFGAHTCSHPPLTQLPADRVEEELARSQEVIQSRTGQQVRIFAQPYGATNETVDDKVRRYFAGAASTRLGIIGPDTNPFKLPRIDAYYLQPWMVSHVGRPWFKAYLELRHGLRVARRRMRQDWTADN